MQFFMNKNLQIEENTEEIAKKDEDEKKIMRIIKKKKMQNIIPNYMRKILAILILMNTFQAAARKNKYLKM